MASGSESVLSSSRRLAPISGWKRNLDTSSEVPHPQPLSHPMGEGGVGLPLFKAERETNQRCSFTSHDFRHRPEAVHELLRLHFDLLEHREHQVAEAGLVVLGFAAERPKDRDMAERFIRELELKWEAGLNLSIIAAAATVWPPRGTVRKTQGFADGRARARRIGHTRAGSPGVPNHGRARRPPTLPAVPRRLH